MSLLRAWRFWAWSIVFLFALLSWDPPGLSADLQPTPDTAEYTLGALTWLRTGRYGIILNGELFPSRYPLGYAALLVPFFALVGPQPYLASTFNWVGALAMLSLFLLVARRLVGPVGAVAAGAFLALSPTIEWLATRIGTEIPSLLVMWAAVALLVLPARPVGSWAALGAGLLVGLSSLLRLPNLLLVLPLLPLSSVSTEASATALRETAKRVVLFGLGVGVGTLPLLAYHVLFFGAPFMNGYRYWDPEFYGTFGATFNPAYLTTAALGNDAMGNAPYYSRILLGLGQGVDRLYVPTMMVLVLAGFWLLTTRRLSGDRRVGVMALLAVVTFLGFFGVYYWQETRLIAPVVPLLLLLAGAAVAWAWSQHRHSWTARVLLVLAFLTLTGQSLLAARNSYLLGAHKPANLPWRVATLRWLDEYTPPTATLVTDLDLALVEEYWRRGTERRIVPLVRQMEWVRRPPLRHVAVGLAAIPPDTRTVFLLSANGQLPPLLETIGTRFSLERVHTATFGNRLVTVYELVSNQHESHALGCVVASGQWVCPL